MSQFTFVDFKRQKDKEKTQEEPDPGRKPIPERIVAGINTNLTATLWKAIHKGPPEKDEVLSSFGISSLMAFTRSACLGKTSTEIQTLFRFPDDKLLAEAGYKKIYQSFLDSEEITFATGVFAQYGYTFTPNIIGLGQNLGAQFLNINFTHPEFALEEINGWVQQATNLKFNAVVNTEDVDHKTKLMLVNLIHFKGNWKRPFKVCGVDKPFFTLNGIHCVETISSTYRFPYAELRNLNARAVGLPYKGNRFMLVIILPLQDSGIMAFKYNLEDEFFTNIRAQLRVEKDIAVEIPKFKLVGKTELKPIFETMGIQTIFSKKAELNPMFENPKDIFLSTIFQVACLELVCEGSESDVEPEVELIPDRECLPIFVKPKPQIPARSFPLKEEPTYFRVNHPFLFYVFDDVFNNVLFTGSYCAACHIPLP